MSNLSHRSRIVFRAARGVIATVLLAVLLCGCSYENDSQVPAIDVDFRFGMRNDDNETQDFVAVTSNSVIISRARSQLALPDSERSLHISGPIERGSGGHNLGWSWHFVPDAWTLTGVSAEVCDGGPQGVEDDLDYWVDTLQSFCPWDSYVKEELSQP
ncbi:MAG: hypothetical protein JSW03_04820 [Candidatus Eiseniibacteriota bacterium]|nr:MAG: hypothetical protein JSW03_04820 [Candidatus Eisenbacteria bacterium]